MAAKLSTALANKLMDTGSFKDIFANCVIDVYAGTQPASPDDSNGGATLLVSVTKASGTFTNETRAVGSLTIAGAAGFVNTVTVNSIDILGGAVSFTGDINATATAVANQINTNPKNLNFVASTTGSSGVITITAVNGLGTLPNTWAVSGTYTTLTGGTYVAMTGGVDATNGLTFGSAALGVLSKDNNTWSGVAVGAGTNTAGWFRMRGSNDSGVAADASKVYPRYDGAITATGGGGQMTLGSLSITFGAPFIVSSAAFTLPLL